MKYKNIFLSLFYFLFMCSFFAEATIPSAQELNTTYLREVTAGRNNLHLATLLPNQTERVGYHYLFNELYRRMGEFEKITQYVHDTRDKANSQDDYSVSDDDLFKAWFHGLVKVPIIEHVKKVLENKDECVALYSQRITKLRECIDSLEVKQKLLCNISTLPKSKTFSANIIYYFLWKPLKNVRQWLIKGKIKSVMKLKAENEEVLKGFRDKGNTENPLFDAYSILMDSGVFAERGAKEVLLENRITEYKEKKPTSGDNTSFESPKLSREEPPSTSGSLLSNDYILVPKKVTMQTGATCGYHALYNVLRSLGIESLETTVNDFINSNVATVAESRNQNKREDLDAKNDLDADEIRLLCKNYIKDDKSIIIIDDIQRYKNGEPNLEQEVLEQLALCRKDIRNRKPGNYYFIIGTMDRKKNLYGHWIALEQLIDDTNTLKYTTMDSSASLVPPVAKVLIDGVLHSGAWDTFENASNLEDILSKIRLYEIFEQRKYALQATSGVETMRVLDEFPSHIIDRIIDGCYALKELMQDQKEVIIASGRTKPFEIIQRACTVLNNFSNGACIDLYTNCNDYEKAGTLIITLTEHQKRQIKLIKEKVDSFA